MTSNWRPRRYDPPTSESVTNLLNPAKRGTRYDNSQRRIVGRAAAHGRLLTDWGRPGLGHRRRRNSHTRRQRQHFDRLRREPAAVPPSAALERIPARRDQRRRHVWSWRRLRATAAVV